MSLATIATRFTFSICRNSLPTMRPACQTQLSPSRLLSSPSPFFTSSIRTLKVLKSIAEVRAARLQLANQPSRFSSDHSAFIGFVPTMGALHEGHFSIVDRSLRDNDLTVVSIFVNPLQFAAGEDYESYPRTLDKDLQLLSDRGVDFAFIPDQQDLYPPEQQHSTYVDVESIHQTFEHQTRPHHFRGVCTVVLKLLNIIQPHRAYFGQKDGVQCIAVRTMVADLNVPIQIVTVPTQREADGLAMSSRNIYLTKEERKVAPLIYQSLTAAYKLYNEDNVNDVNRLKSAVKAILDGHDSSSGVELKVEYISLCNSLNGVELLGRIGEGVNGQYMSGMLSIAVLLGKVRLIDNVILGPRVRTSLD